MFSKSATLDPSKVFNKLMSQLEEGGEGYYHPVVQSLAQSNPCYQVNVNTAFFTTQSRLALAPNQQTPSSLNHSLWLAHTNQSFFNQEEMGEATATQFAKFFDTQYRGKDKSGVNDIYLLACEAGLIDANGFSFAQAIANALANEGFSHVKVHAITNPKLPNHPRMATKLLQHREHYYVSAHLFTEQQYTSWEKLLNSNNQDDSTSPDISALDNIENDTEFFKMRIDYLIDELDRPQNTFTPNGSIPARKDIHQEWVLYQLYLGLRKIERDSPNGKKDSKKLMKELWRAIANSTDGQWGLVLEQKINDFKKNNPVNCVNTDGYLIACALLRLCTEKQHGGLSTRSSRPSQQNQRRLTSVIGKAAEWIGETNQNIDNFYTTLSNEYEKNLLINPKKTILTLWLEKYDKDITNRSIIGTEKYYRCKKNDFLATLNNILSAKDTTKQQILELFDALKEKEGEFAFIHHERHPHLDRLFLLPFKKRANQEKWFWHTRSYQKALKLMKESYLTKKDEIVTSEADKIRENAFIDYIRGNAPYHCAKTSTRKKHSAI